MRNFLTAISRFLRITSPETPDFRLDDKKSCPPGNRNASAPQAFSPTFGGCQNNPFSRTHPVNPLAGFSPPRTQGINGCHEDVDSGAGTGVGYPDQPAAAGAELSWCRAVGALLRLSRSIRSPPRIGHQVVQRLMRPPDIVGGQARRHRFDALALTGQQQPRAIRFQGLVTIGVPGGLRQTVEIGRQAFLLGAWRQGSGAYIFNVSCF